MEASLAVLGADTTYASQLDAVGRAWFGARWLGVYAQEAEGGDVDEEALVPPAASSMNLRNIFFFSESMR